MRELNTSQEEFLSSELVRAIVRYAPLKCPAVYSYYITKGEWDWQRMVVEDFTALQDCLAKMV